MEVKAATMRDRVNDADNQGKWFRYKEAIDDYVKRLFLNKTLHQCCGSGMIYSGFGSSFEFSEFRIRIRIRIQAKAPDPCGFGSSPYF